MKIERKDELTPMVFGVFINQSLLRQNKITDMNIYFYDPINAVRFIPSKVTSRRFDRLRLSDAVCGGERAKQRDS